MDKFDNEYIDLLDIDSFRVVKDNDFPSAATEGRNNYTTHWIAHICDVYLEDKTDGEDSEKELTGILDSDEIKAGKCYYCKIPIPEPITALWSMLEWQEAGDILHPFQDDPVEHFKVSNGTA